MLIKEMLLFIVNGLSRGVIKVSGFLFSGFILCGSAAAEEYKFRLQFFYKTPDYFSSAAAACKNIDPKLVMSRNWVLYDFDHVNPQGTGGAWTLLVYGDYERGHAFS
jgi:hypothetical protein